MKLPFALLVLFNSCFSKEINIPGFRWFLLYPQFSSIHKPAHGLKISAFILQSWLLYQTMDKLVEITF